MQYSPTRCQQTPRRDAFRLDGRILPVEKVRCVRLDGCELGVARACCSAGDVGGRGVCLGHGGGEGLNDLGGPGGSGTGDRAVLLISVSEIINK